MSRIISRREFCAYSLVTSASALAGCELGTTTLAPVSDGRITARPGVPPLVPVAPGIHDLSVLGSDRHCWIIVPENYDNSKRWPLTLFFRGAITPAQSYMEPLRAIANEMGMVVLAPEATGRTWDLILRGGFGPDVEFINRSLHTAYQAVNVDQDRVFTSGFSDGGSYSLSLGLTNGDFFKKVVAYAPGFMQPASENGHPDFFIAHGALDDIIPVEVSRLLAQQLEAAGYACEFVEWDGPHAVSLSQVRASFQFMLGIPRTPPE